MLAVALLLPLAHMVQSDLKTWYGPRTVTFQVEFAGNPYDPEENDVRVQFLGPKGDPIERLAYFDGESGYKATLVTPIKGRYVATLYRNGKKMLELPQEGLIDVESPLAHGFVHPDKTNLNRFRWDDGTPFYPMGFDLGWRAGDNTISIPDQLTKMGKNGVSWSRIWACNWDGKNPWWSDDPGVIKGQMSAKVFDRWQTIVEAADRAGVEFQMVMFNHGSFSSKVDPDWPKHPWNAANGGFLKDAADFFTDAEAKRRAKMWLRYAVARYADSPSILAWELFNEVEWVDARYQNRWPDIAAWHKEMAEYVRSIDPYGHMVTTSSAIDQKALYEPMDYYQPHTYPKDVLAAIGGAKLPTDKPAFFGEFAPPGKSKAEIAAGIRDGIYGSIVANQAATAMYWAWDQVEALDLYPEFRNAAEVVQRSGIASHPKARTLNIHVSNPAVKGIAIGESDWMILRLTGTEGSIGTVNGLSVGDGNYSLTAVDLESGDVKAGPVDMTHFSLAGYKMPSRDVVLIFRKM
jgi:hypothetical protein